MQLLTTSITATLGASFLIWSSGSVCAQTADFTFDTTPLYTGSPMTLTQNGITAIFTDENGLRHSGSDSYDDGQFAVVSKDSSGQYYSSAFSGNVLSSAAGFAGKYAPLVILFNRPIDSVSFNFALWGYPAASAPVTFSAYDGEASVGTQSLTTTPAPFCWFPEGKVDYSSVQPFNKIVLDANPAPYLIIDNVKVTADPVPEASTMVSSGLLALGLGGLAISARRRSVKAAP